MKDNTNGVGAMTKFIEEALAEVLGVPINQIGDVEFKLYTPCEYWNSDFAGESGFVHGRQFASLKFQSTLGFLLDEFGSLKVNSRVKIDSTPTIYQYTASLLYGPETQKIAQAVFTGLSVE